MLNLSSYKQGVGGEDTSLLKINTRSMKQTNTGLVQGYLKTMAAANKSNDGNRCMIAPSPDLKKQLKTDLKKLKRDLGSSVFSNMLKPLSKTKVGFNDALLRPGNAFSPGMSASRMRLVAASRSPVQDTVRVIVVLVDFSDKVITHTKKNNQDFFF